MLDRKKAGSPSLVISAALLTGLPPPENSDASSTRLLSHLAVADARPYRSLPHVMVQRLGAPVRAGGASVDAARGGGGGVDGGAGRARGRLECPDCRLAGRSLQLVRP